VTLFDLIALCIILGFALIGFVRGAIREVMTILAFFLAALIAIFALRFTGPLGRKLIDPDWAATALAVVLSFVLAYIALRLSGSYLTKKVHDIETLGALDRSVGVGFGLLRALVLLGVFYLVFNAATPPERVPRWISHAALYPLAKLSATGLRALAPEGSAVADRLGPSLEKAVREGAGDKKAQSSANSSGKGTGYDEQSRKDVDALVEKNR
jgi:membrane protein required for colicin V production